MLQLHGKLLTLPLQLKSQCFNSKLLTVRHQFLLSASTARLIVISVNGAVTAIRAHLLAVILAVKWIKIQYMSKGFIINYILQCFNCTVICQQQRVQCYIFCVSFCRKNFCCKSMLRQCCSSLLCITEMPCQACVENAAAGPRRPTLPLVALIKNPPGQLDILLCRLTFSQEIVY